MNAGVQDEAVATQASLFAPVLVPAMPPPSPSCISGKNVPDGEDTTGLGEVGLLLDTTDSLLEDGRDLSRGGLGLGEGAGLDGSGCGISLWTDQLANRRPRGAQKQ